jgi:hypothetical protein
MEFAELKQATSWTGIRGIATSIPPPAGDFIARSRPVTIARTAAVLDGRFSWTVTSVSGIGSSCLEIPEPFRW